MAAKKREQDDLKKLVQEKQTLQAEVERRSQAMQPQAACKEILAYIAATAEPFCDSNPKANPWANTEAAGGGCCTIQ